MGALVCTLVVVTGLNLGTKRKCLTVLESRPVTTTERKIDKVPLHLIVMHKISNQYKFMAMFFTFLD